MRQDLGRLGRSSLVYGAGQVLLRAIGLLLLPVFTRYLSPADYGVMSVLSIATLLLGPVAALGVPAAIGLLYFDGDDADRRITISSAVTIEVATGILLVIACAALSGPLLSVLVPGGAEGDWTMLLLISVATTGLANIQAPMLTQLQFERRAATFVLLTAAASLLTIAVSVALVIWMRLGVWGIVAGSLIGQTAGLALTLAVSLRMGPWRPRRQRMVRLLRLGLPLTPSFLFLFVILQFNRYVLQIAHGLGALGIYTVGFNLGYVMSLAVAGFTSAWFPFFLEFGSRPSEARPLFARIATYYVVGIGAVTLVFFVLARAVVMVMTQPAFSDAFQAVGASATAQFLLGLHSIVLAPMYFAKAVRPGVVIQGLAAASGVVMNVVLVGPFGIAGVGLAMVATLVLMVGLQSAWNAYRGYLRIPYEWHRLARFAVVFVALALVFSWPRDLPVAAEVGLSIVGLTAIGSTVLVLLTPSERAGAFALARDLSRALVGRGR